MYREGAQGVVREQRVIVGRLDELSFPCKIAFVGACCERLIPCYDAFVLVHGWGESKTVFRALDAIWQYAAGEKVDEAQVRELLHELETCVPDLEQFKSIYTMPAVYAVDALASSLKFCVHGTFVDAANVVELTVATVYDYVSSVNYPYSGFMPLSEIDSFHDWVFQAPLLLAELGKQKNDLELLAKQDHPGPTFLNQLRSSARTVGIDPVGRGLLTRK